MDVSNDWYNNKELFERLNDLSREFVHLRGEMKETRTLIKQYNGLREEIEKVHRENVLIKEKISNIINREEGRNGVWENLRNWGGWIFGFLTLIILIYNQIV